MIALIYVLTVVVSYLLGAVSFARIIGARVLPGEDLNSLQVPIGDSGEEFRATSVSASIIRLKAGPRWGCMTSVLDMIKAAVPALILYFVFPGRPLFLYSAAAAVVGHNFPVYYRFKGGRGISPIYGGLFVIDWLTIPVATAAGAFVSLALLRYAAVMYFGVTLAMIPWLWFRFRDVHYLAYAIIINISFWIASIPEAREYIAHLRKGHFKSDRYLVSSLTPEERAKLWGRKRDAPEDSEEQKVDDED